MLLLHKNTLEVLHCIFYLSTGTEVLSEKYKADFSSRVMHKLMLEQLEINPSLLHAVPVFISFDYFGVIAFICQTTV